MRNLGSLFQTLTGALVTILLLAVNSITQTVNAQLVLDPTPTANSLVQDVILGPGLTATNVQFTGDLDALGWFDGTLSNIGMDSGVVMTTGTLLGLGGPAGPNDNGSSGVDNLAAGYPDLTTIAGIQTFNASVLEFDFVPVGDNMQFNFVFGSEEYMEFVDLGVNDAFGFFISGPGFNGPYANNAENIALIPGTNIAISIDSLNLNDYGQFYVDNGDGNSAPQNVDSTVVQYDGFTTVLQANAQVQCNQTYHIVIAIADAGDGVWDSGVFIEANSFSSIGIEVDVSTVTGDSVILEGCSNATFTFTRPDSIGDLWIQYEIGGNAIEGTDFNTLPDSILVPDSLFSSTLVVIPIADSLWEGSDTLTVTVFTVNSCGDTVINFATIYIVDSLTIVPNTPDFLVCPGTSMWIGATASGAIPDYTFTWGDGTVGDSIYVELPLTGPEIFIVTVTDDCTSAPVTDTVFVALHPILEITALADTFTICPNDPAYLDVITIDGAAPFVYSWTTGASTPSTTVNPGTTELYYITVIDDCDQSRTDSVLVTVNVGQPQSLFVSDQTICVTDTAFIVADYSGGFGGQQFSWTGVGVLTQSGHNASMLHQNAVQSYNVLAIDACGGAISTSFDVYTEDCQLVIPNVISPNGDSFNETFFIINMDKHPNSRLEVYNRWGKMVYENDNYQNQWNGDDYSGGTYYYILTPSDPNQGPFTGELTILNDK
jgi:gliding motility-associated-like protein